MLLQRCICVASSFVRRFIDVCARVMINHTMVLAYTLGSHVGFLLCGVVMLLLGVTLSPFSYSVS